MKGWTRPLPCFYEGAPVCGSQLLQLCFDEGCHVMRVPTPSRHSKRVLQGGPRKGAVL
jgi:hypothetical protein